MKEVLYLIALVITLSVLNGCSSTPEDTSQLPIESNSYCEDKDAKNKEECRDTIQHSDPDTLD